MEHGISEANALDDPDRLPAANSEEKGESESERLARKERLTQRLKVEKDLLGTRLSRHRRCLF